MNETPDRDPADVGFNFALTDSSLSATVKSRAIAAVDWLLGGKVERKGLGDQKALRAAAREERMRDKVADALTDHIIAQIPNDPELVRQARNELLNDLTNVRGVAGAAIEHLESEAPRLSKEQVDDVEPTVSEPVLHRLRHYAKGASTEELRERWGRVLASEILKPGTFSLKVLRVVDELGSREAQLFERLCRYRLNKFVPRFTTSWLEYDERLLLVEAGLIVDPGLTGHVVDLGRGTSNGVHIWGLESKGAMFTFAALAPWQKAVEEDLLSNSNGTPHLEVIILTDVGMAISSILHEGGDDTIAEVARVLSNRMPDTVQFHRRSGPGEKWQACELPQKV